MFFVLVEGERAHSRHKKLSPFLPKTKIQPITGDFVFSGQSQKTYAFYLILFSKNIEPALCFKWILAFWRGGRRFSRRECRQTYMTGAKNKPNEAKIKKTLKTTGSLQVSSEWNIFFYKGGDPAAGSPTATLLRLHPNHRPYRRRLPPNKWLAHRCRVKPTFVV